MKGTLSMVLVVLAVAITVGCSSAGADPEAGDSETDLVVTGNTDYSSDGGTTVEDASFRFSVPSITIAALGDATASPISGTLRAGNVVLAVEGHYDGTNNTFSIRAAGTTSSSQFIEVTVEGIYDPRADTISSGQTVATVTDEGSGTTQYFQSTRVETGDSAINPISDTSGTETATPVSSAQKKFWEGTWVFTRRTYATREYDEVTDSWGWVTSSTPTAYYRDESTSVTATATQYILRETTIFSLATKNADGSLFDESFYETNLLLDIAEGSDVEGDFADVVVLRISAGDYFKLRLYQPAIDHLWARDFADGSATNEYDRYFRSTAAAAQADLTSLESENIDTGSQPGLRRVR